MGKRPVIIPSVAIAVVAVAAVTIPAFADDGGADAPRGNGGLPAATGAQAIAAPQTLAALQRDLGLTEPAPGSARTSGAGGPTGRCAPRSATPTPAPG
jgi:hypothetical protein